MLPIIEYESIVCHETYHVMRVQLHGNYQVILPGLVDCLILEHLQTLSGGSIFPIANNFF